MQQMWMLQYQAAVAGFETAAQAAENREERPHREFQPARLPPRSEGPPVDGVDGNWKCNQCRNVNYQIRDVCNRCQAPKPPEVLQRLMQEQYQRMLQQYSELVNGYEQTIDGQAVGQPCAPSASAAQAPLQVSPTVQSLTAPAAGSVVMPIEERPVDLHTQVRMLEAQVQEAEMKAKRAAQQSRHFVGVIANFDTRSAQGFIACEETYKRYKKDLFIDRESYHQSARLGDTVVFSLGFNKKGEVRACDVRKLQEVSRLKLELEKKKAELIESRQVPPAPVLIMSKRPHESADSSAAKRLKGDGGKGDGYADAKGDGKGLKGTGMDGYSTEVWGAIPPPPPP